MYCICRCSSFGRSGCNTFDGGRPSLLGPAFSDIHLERLLCRRSCRGGIEPGSLDLRAGRRYGPSWGSGAFGGIQAGYNFQEGFWVFGAEGDIAYAGINGSTACPDAAWTCQSRINWLGSARLRAGVAFDRVLLYGTGGVGFGNVRIQTNNPASGTFGQSRTQVGWTLGAGAEFAVTDAWSVKAEYVYYDLGRATYTVDNALNVSARTHVHTGKIGLNFRW